MANPFQALSAARDGHVPTSAQHGASLMIRVAVLKPGRTGTPLKIGFRDVAPNDASSTYEIISYDRSLPSRTAVSVESVDVDIPTSLHQILSKLRRADRDRLVWVDVLCLEQQDMNLRISQAKHLGRIVSSASNVIVWLGEGDDKTREAFAVIKTLSTRWLEISTNLEIPERVSLVTAQHIADARARLQALSQAELKPTDEAVWQAVAAIYNSSYFQHIYIFAEIVPAKKATVACGPCTLSWIPFTEAPRAAMCNGNLPFVQWDTTGFATASYIRIAQRNMVSSGGIELLPMVQSTRKSTCSDLRDHVFAMLPLVRPSLRTADHNQPLPPLVPDYTAPVQRVFINAARYIIVERQDLCIWVSEGAPHLRRITGLPSWVPDWSSDSTTGLLTRDLTLRGISDDSPNPKPLHIDDADVLHVQARLLDKITYTSPVFTHRNASALALHLQDHLPTDTFLGPWDAYARTLTLDNFGTGFPQAHGSRRDADFLQRGLRELLTTERIAKLSGVDALAEQPQQPMAEHVRANWAANMDEIMRLGASSDPQLGQQFREIMLANCVGRRFFVTSRGFIGMSAVEVLPEEGNEEQQVEADEQEQQQQPEAGATAPEPSTAAADTGPGIRTGDIVATLHGGFVPYILRSTGQDEQGQRHTLVGEAYVHGVMRAECFGQGPGYYADKIRDVEIVDVEIE